MNEQSIESVLTDPKLRCLREELEDHPPAQVVAMIVALRHVDADDVRAAIRRLKADLKRGEAVPPGDMTGVLTGDLRLLLALLDWTVR